MNISDNEKLKYEIEKIVNKWDVDWDSYVDKKAGLKEEKINIIMNWKEKVGNDDLYKKLLKILEQFTNYSTTKSYYTYNKIFKNNFNENDKFFVTPVSNKPTQESSLTMYDKFIEANQLREKKSKYLFPNFRNIQLQASNLDKNISDIKANKHAISDIEEIYEDLEKTNKFFFLQLIELQYLIFVDDFIGTGKSISKFIENNKNFFVKFYKLVDQINSSIDNVGLNTFETKNTNRKKYELTIVFIVLESTKTGIDDINKKAKEIFMNNTCNNKIKIKVSVKNGNLSESVFEGNSVFNDNEQVIESEFNNLIRKLKIKPGKFNKNLNIRSYYNVPNNTFPLIREPSRPSDKNLWEALFPRTLTTGDDTITDGEFIQFLAEKRMSSNHE